MHFHSVPIFVKLVSRISRNFIKKFHEFHENLFKFFNLILQIIASQNQKTRKTDVKTADNSLRYLQAQKTIFYKKNYVIETTPKTTLRQL